MEQIPRIEVEGSKARLILKTTGVPADTANLDELTQVVFLRMGDMLYSNESECFVLVFGSRFWVIPIGVHGWRELLYEKWHKAICEKNISFEGTLAFPPFPWRKRVLGIIPVPKSKTAIFPSKALPKNWKIKPYSFEQWVVAFE